MENGLSAQRRTVLRRPGRQPPWLSTCKIKTSRPVMSGCRFPAVVPSREMKLRFTQSAIRKPTLLCESRPIRRAWQLMYPGTLPDGVDSATARRRKSQVLPRPHANGDPAGSRAVAAVGVARRFEKLQPLVDELDGSIENVSSPNPSRRSAWRYGRKFIPVRDGSLAAWR